jgi:chloramphenicol-sensitive protein RarD
VNSGYIYAFLAYFSWGLFPIYWYCLKHIDSAEILAHRITWACFFYGLIWAYVTPSSVRREKILLAINRKHWLIPSAFLIGFNWFVYVYAVNRNHVLETSLGYFLSPLIIVGLGWFVLG